MRFSTFADFFRKGDGLLDLGHEDSVVDESVGDAGAVRAQVGLLSGVVGSAEWVVQRVSTMISVTVEM